MKCTRKKAATSCLFLLLTVFFQILVCRDSMAYPTVYPSGTTIYNPDNTYTGYTIYTIHDPNAVIMVDMEGMVVHYWSHPTYRLGYAEPLSNGNLLVFATQPEQRAPTIMLEMDWDGNVIWELSSTLEERWFHHDFERLDNGNTLILCSTQREVLEISPDPIVDDHIIEVDQSGAIVWSWYTSDHYDELGFDDTAKQLISEHAGDWSHTNSIQSLPPNITGDPAFNEGNILVSQRHTNIMFVIDKTTGEIVWRVGPADNITIGQHNPTLLPEGMPSAGNILVFDNGGVAGYPPEGRLYSRVIEVDPVSKQVLREYNARISGLDEVTFFSGFVSGAQRLPNGNTLICEGETGRLFEISPRGRIVWEYVTPFWTHFANHGFRNKRIYRAWRVSPDWPRGPLP